jgi:predicted RNA-binding Zn-ribbon protein involved in translation (DUF1610 family)
MLSSLNRWICSPPGDGDSSSPEPRAMPVGVMLTTNETGVKINSPTCSQYHKKMRKFTQMSTKEPVTEKPGRTPDSAYSFSFAIAIGLVLFIGGLVISLTLSESSSIGLIFGIPLLLAGLIVPLIMLRDLFKHNEVAGPCPYCGAPITTSDATIQLECPTCKGVLVVREMKLYPANTSS